ncbi:hypothetical protein ABOM_001293 [Aspergillus bombycis]|uniref:Uncharacterized protein n=1 Tax=Aspergillus bombycis TaxID=109264 RepID=A0A1F8AF57_9EURO|nr:hypothetical protein ABOM_001293 [Aspergillus bombycis]OGM49958.1 hypothetical protein ABOM_001293 [Aspergillus bombycis]
MESSPYPARLDQLSPPHSLPENTWETDMSRPTPSSDVHNAGEDAMPLPQRLAKIAHMISQNADVSSEDTTTVHHCLNTLEALLDPRPKLTQEVVKCRPTRIYPETSHPVASAASCSVPMEDRGSSAFEPSSSQLIALLNEVTALNVDLDQRRKESSQIYDLLKRECQGLSRRISELENEVHELETDIMEGSAEREALHGTVCGLEAWVNGWQNERKLGASRQNKAKRWMRRKPEERYESDAEALLEGITAWMRGWKDVEEGFRVRERDRQDRREERQRRTRLATDPADNT